MKVKQLKLLNVFLFLIESGDFKLDFISPFWPSSSVVYKPPWFSYMGKELCLFNISLIKQKALSLLNLFGKVDKHCFERLILKKMVMYVNMLVGNLPKFKVTSLHLCLPPLPVNQTGIRTLHERGINAHLDQELQMGPGCSLHTLNLVERKM